jgi:hypothetical protein
MDVFDISKCNLSLINEVTTIPYYMSLSNCVRQEYENIRLSILELTS